MTRIRRPWLAAQFRQLLALYEQTMPHRQAVARACDALGIDLDDGQALIALAGRLG